MLQDTRIILLLPRRELISAEYCQAPSISQSNSKGPYFHLTKQFQHPRFHRTLDEIHSCQTSSSSIRLNSKDLRSWIGKAQKKKKNSPHHPWKVPHWTPFPVFGQQFYIFYTCYILALGYVTLCWHHTYTAWAQAMKICKDILSWHQLV